MTSHLAQQSLYVMQNEFGLIKIGRSINPEQRRVALEIYEKCRVVLILVRPGEGHREEECHRRVENHRIANEWFDGTDDARVAIAKALSPTGVLIWRYDFDPERADIWLDEFWGRQIDNAVPKAVNKLLGHVRKADKPDWVIDSFAWDMCWLMETGTRPVGLVRRGTDGETFVTANVDGEELRMPCFTRDLEAAMSLWPQGTAPPLWEGTALECCKAGLEARRAAWKAKRVPRKTLAR